MAVSKYRAKRTEAHGRTFASQKEAKRYGELLLLERAGEISALICQPKYDLIVNGKKVGRYTLDFGYLDHRARKNVVEEVKGYRVRDYALRKNLFCALYPGLDHREV